jgi:hypothetical protein
MILFEMSGVIALGVLVLVLNIPVTIFAGPPYITDDQNRSNIATGRGVPGLNLHQTAGGLDGYRPAP